MKRLQVFITRVSVGTSFVMFAVVVLVLYYGSMRIASRQADIASRGVSEQVKQRLLQVMKSGANSAEIEQAAASMKEEFEEENGFAVEVLGHKAPVVSGGGSDGRKSNDALDRAKLSGQKTIYKDGDRLEFYFPLRATSACISCHTTARPDDLLGIVIVKHDTGPSLQADRVALFLFVLALFPLPIIAAFVLTRVFLRRVDRSVEEIRKCARLVNETSNLEAVDLRTIRLGFVEFDALFGEVHKLAETYKATAIRDITDRKRAARVLEASELRYRRLFEAAKDGILVLDAATGKIVDVNPFMSELTGFSRESFLDKYIWEIGPFSDIADSKALFAQLQLEKYIRYKELPLKTSDGRSVAVEFVSNVYLVDRQKVIQCNIRDISERIVSDRSLASAKAFLDSVINVIADPVFVKDDQRKFTLVNDALCTMVGRSREALLGQDGDDMFPEDQVAVFRKMDAVVFETGEENANEESLSNLSTGEVRTIATRKTRYVDPTGRRFLVGVIRDITERKLAEKEALNISVAKVKAQRLESIGTLAAGVAHEINNPLNIMMNYAQLILDDKATTGDQAEYAANIVRESERVARIVKNLLAFSRQETQEHSPADVQTLVGSTLSLVGATFRKDQIALDIEIPEELPKVRCRSQQIQQVLMNLLTNARDALNGRFPGAASDKRIRVMARPFEQGGTAWIRVTVEDWGGGIPPEVSEHMFDPFFSTKARDKGTGLGLSISYGIMEEHQGKLWFETEQGVGTRFHVDLRVDGGQSLPLDHQLPSEPTKV